MTKSIKKPEELLRLVSRSDPSLAATTRNLSDEGAALQIDAMRDLLLSSLELLRQELDGILVIVLAKMKRVRGISLFGAVVAALSGLLMATSVALGVGDDWHKVIAAGFASIGGLVVVFSDYFQMAPNGRRIASSEEYGKLSQMASELLLIEKRTQRHELFPLSAQEIEQMIDQTDSYAAHINMLKVN